MLHYIIYTSRSYHPWSQAELLQLLDKSWTNNKAKNISGMLVYLGDRFIQLLEGSEEDVQSTFSKIKYDPRHRDLTLLLEGSHENRIFKTWSMGFKNLEYSEFEELTGFSNPTDFFMDDNINNHSHPALIFLKLFYDKNYRDFTDQYII